MVKKLAPIYGLVLMGGQSTRMKRDKAQIKFHRKPQIQHLAELINKYVSCAFVSCRRDQSKTITDLKLKPIYDLKKYREHGPLSGILSALSQYPKVAWLVIACDLPFIDDATLKHLLRYRQPKKIATAYRSALNSWPEPLCAIYEPQAKTRLLTFFKQGIYCPRKILINSKPRLLKLKNPDALQNINTPSDYRLAKKMLSKSKP